MQQSFQVRTEFSKNQLANAQSLEVNSGNERMLIYSPKRQMKTVTANVPTPGALNLNDNEPEITTGKVSKVRANLCRSVTEHSVTETSATDGDVGLSISDTLANAPTLTQK